jgi:hypothetical protein
MKSLISERIGRVWEYWRSLQLGYTAEVQTVKHALNVLPKPMCGFIGVRLLLCIYGELLKGAALRLVHQLISKTTYSTATSTIISLFIAHSFNRIFEQNWRMCPNDNYATSDLPNLPQFISWNIGSHEPKNLLPTQMITSDGGFRLLQSNERHEIPFSGHIPTEWD